MHQRWILLSSLLFSACASTPAPMGPGSRAIVADASVPLEAPAVEAVEAAPADAPAPAEAPASPAFEVDRPEPASPGFEFQPAAEPQVQSRSSSPVWHQGQGLAQGWLGVTSLTSSNLSDGTVPGSDTGDSDLGTLPVIGGGGQWKLAGKGVDIGVEAGINFAFQANGGFFVTGSNGATVAVSIDSLIFDLYGGAFVSKYLGDKARIYLSAGPLMQWASYDQSSIDTTYNGNGSGFGFGYYVRTGIELVVGNGTMMGLGGRWFDTEIDLSGGLGDWDLAGAQLLFTVTRAF